MRRRQRATGEQFMVAIIDQQVVLEAGSELHLVRIRPGTDGDEPTHALRVIPPTAAVTKRQLAAAARDRLDGSALRLDPRDQPTRTIPAGSTS